MESQPPSVGIAYFEEIGCLLLLLVRLFLTTTSLTPSLTYDAFLLCQFSLKRKLNILTENLWKFNKNAL